MFLKYFTLKFVNPPKRRIQKNSGNLYFLLNFNQFPKLQNWVDLIYCSFSKVNMQYKKNDFILFIALKEIYIELILQNAFELGYYVQIHACSHFYT